MSDLHTPQCDICGAVKGVSNHWIVGCRHADYEGIVYMAAAAFNSRDNPQIAFDDLCGSECAHVHFSTWLESNYYLSALERTQS